MSERWLPLLGITIGDVCGSGPEIVAKALALPEVRDKCRPLVIGDVAVLRQAYAITGVAGQVRPVASLAEAVFEPGVVDVVDLKNVDLAGVTYGQVNAMAGGAAGGGSSTSTGAEFSNGVHTPWISASGRP